MKKDNHFALALQRRGKHFFTKMKYRLCGEFQRTIDNKKKFYFGEILNIPSKKNQIEALAFKY